MRRRKILIVFERFGTGHLRMARILYAILAKEPGVDVSMLAGNELLGESRTPFTARAWNFFLRNNYIFCADAVLNFAARLLLLPAAETLLAPRFYQALDEWAGDVIISTADVYNKALGTWAGERKKDFFIFLTDISIFLDLTHPRATHLVYFDETHSAVHSYDYAAAYYAHSLGRHIRFAEAARYIAAYMRDYLLPLSRHSIYRSVDNHYLPRNRAVVHSTGPLAEEKHFFDLDRVAIREQVGLHTAREIVVLLSGGIGGRQIGQLVRRICSEYRSPIDLVAICGNDKTTYARLQAFACRNPHVHLVAHGFRDDLELFLASADCVIARPSAGVFMETLIHRVPMLAYGRTLTNDAGTCSMIEKHSLGRVCREEAGLSEQLSMILADRNAYKENIEKLLSQYPKSFHEKADLLRRIILG